jgi:hypothetical protein
MTSVVPVLDRVLDADSHDMAPLQYWGPIWGPAAGQIAEQVTEPSGPRSGTTSTPLSTRAMSRPATTTRCGSSRGPRLHPAAGRHERDGHRDVQPVLRID